MRSYASDRASWALRFPRLSSSASTHPSRTFPIEVPRRRAWMRRSPQSTPMAFRQVERNSHCIPNSQSGSSSRQILGCLGGTLTPTSTESSTPWSGVGQGQHRRQGDTPLQSIAIGFHDFATRQGIQGARRLERLYCTPYEAREYAVALNISGSAAAAPGHDPNCRIRTRVYARWGAIEIEDT